RAGLDDCGGRAAVSGHRQRMVDAADLGLIGTAQGMVISPNQTLTLQEVPLRYAGSSGGVLQTGQRIGTSMGLAIMTALAFAVTAVSNWHMGMVSAFAAIAVVVALAGLVGLSEVRRGRSRRR